MVEVTQSARDAAREWMIANYDLEPEADYRSLCLAFAAAEQRGHIAGMREAAEWQSIETFAEPTAYSSGSSVLICTADGTVGEAYYRNFEDEDEGWWWINTGWADYPEPARPEPTHWMPLPSPAIRQRATAIETGADHDR